MVALEETWLASGLPVAALMDKVGVAMASWLLDRPDLLADGVLVLVGPGHNGGDGLVVARELMQAGILVQIWCPLPLRQPLTRDHHRHIRWLGVPERLESPDPSSPALWVEALFGLGQSRPLPPALADLLQARQRDQPGRLVSLDLPAGLDGDSGKPLAGVAAVAVATLTVGLIKQGLVQDQALDHVGALQRIDPGIPKQLLQALGDRPTLRVLGSDLQTLPRPTFPRAATKYQRGRLLVLAGSARYPGAGLLALLGAQASGAGSVKAAVPAVVADDLWSILPEFVLAGSLPSNVRGGLDWNDWLRGQDLQRLDALLVGPGLGTCERCWDANAAPLQHFDGLLVLDADAINQLAASQTGTAWLRNRSGPTWLTPHAGEFQRLFPEFGLDQPIEAARRAAASCGVFVLLKGAHSLVATPEGDVHQLISGDARAARTGLGDVLAGFAAGWGARAVAAQDRSAFASTLTAAALLHAEAARCCEGGSTARQVARRLASLVHDDDHDIAPAHF